MNAAASSATTANIVRIWTMTGLACVALVGGSWFLHKSLHRATFHHQPPPPVLWDTNAEFVATERSGREVRWADLRGKVVVCASLYTVCPHGCAAVVGEMQKLLRDFGNRADFHLVSVAVAPERDTPQLLDSFAGALNLKPSDPWWFVTGTRESLWGFLSDRLRLETPRPIPEAERLNPLDFYEHDLRIVLVDRAGRVRGHYQVFHPEPDMGALMREKLEADTLRLLDDPDL